MAIAKLSIDLETRLASFERDMKTMASLADGAASRIQSAFSGLGLLFTGLAGALSVGALKGAFDSYVEGAARLDDFAEIVGSTTEKVSGLTAVAKISGTDLGQLEAGMVKLAKATATAGDETTDTGAAFAALKLDPAELRLLDTSDQLKLVADRLDEYEDSAAKTAVATTLLGKSGAQLLPYLKDLAASGELVVKVTSEQAATAEEYEKNLKRLSAAQGAVAKMISAEVLPAANVFVKTMVDMISGTDGVRGSAKALAADGSIREWALGAARAAAFVIDAFDGVLRTVQIVGKGIGAAAAQVGAVISGDFKGAATIGSEYLVDADVILSRKLFSTALEENIGKLKATGSAAVEAREKLKFAGGIAASGGGKSGGRGRGGSERLAGFVDYDQQLTERIAAAIDKTDVVKAATLVRELQKLDELAAAGLDPAIVQAVRDDLTGATKLAADELARLNRLLDETPTGKLEAVRDDMIFLTGAFEKGRIAEEQYLEAVAARLDKVSEKTKDAADEMDEFAKSAAQNIQSTLADFLFDPFSEGLDGMARKFTQVIQRMLAEAVAAQLAKALFGDMGTTGKVGGWIGAAISAIGFHQGGMVGAPGAETFTRSVPVTTFSRARRYHSGGLVGDEVPAILKKGELVLTQEQQRGMVAAPAPAQPQNIRIINAFDQSVIGDYLGSAAGERIIMNAVQRNAGAMRQALA
jgi:hypothetical protein